MTSTNWQENARGGAAVAEVHSGGTRTVACHYVKKGPEGSSVCTAGQTSYLPSEFELQEYCRSDRYRLCPFYCRRQVAEDAEAFLGKERESAEGGKKAPDAGKDPHEQR